MATVHKISEDLFEDSFDLIALHCNMECYALAYHINKVAQILLIRAKKDLKIDGFSYPTYEYKDDVKGEEWYLVSNILKEEESNENEGLFQNSTTLKFNYLLEERKEINYVLKLYPETGVDVEKTINALRSIPKISMAYQIHADNLKSKRNLIF
jgi:hypothetical protein